MKNVRIYVSSTSQDLKEHRLAVVGAILRAGHTPICMEQHAAGNVLPKDECVREVATCELYVGIFAWRYGFIPPQCKTSITEVEYREAKRLGIPTLIFLLDENVEWPPEFREQGENDRRIRELRGELKLKNWVRPFTNPDNLAVEVLAAISAELMRNAFEEAQAATPSDRKKQQHAIEAIIQKQAEADHDGPAQPHKPPPIPVPEKLIRHFQDRVAELAKLRQCLDNKNLRMVLVCGRGGMGKTTLVAKLVLELMKNPHEHIVYVPLGESGVRTPDRIVDLLSRTLDSEAAEELKEIWIQEGCSLRERFAAILQGPLAHRRCLIVLDNLESIMDDENRIRQEFSGLRQLIDSCLEYDHAAMLLVTSRRALTLSPEAEIAAIGRRVQIPLDEGLPEDFAIALLRELDPDGRLGIRNETDEVLGNVVRRCRCIPRTLETLVGTLLQRSTWTLETLLENESDLARLIEDPARELFTNLSPDQQLVMQALAIYDQSVPSAAVRAILPALPVDYILDNLFRNFAVTYDRGRFSLHPLNRQYAYSQIPEQGSDYSKPALHNQAAQFYRKLRRPADQWKTLNDVEPQLNEFQHLVYAKSYDDACRVLNEIDREHLSTWGYSQLVIKLRSQLVGRIKDRGLEELNLGNLGSAHLDSGEAVKAKEYYEHTIEIARETRNPENEGRWMGNLGLAYGQLGKQDQAIELLTGALAIAKRIGDQRHENRWLGNLTQISLSLGKTGVQDAIENYQQAISLARKLDDQRFVMNWSMNLGAVYLSLAESAKAKEHFSTALQASRRIGGRIQTCRILIKLGEVHRYLGETAQQAECYEQAREVFGEMHSPAEEGNVLIKLAAVYESLGQRQKQIRCFDEALKIAQDIGDQVAERRLVLTLGDILVQVGDIHKATDCYHRAVKNAHEKADRTDECTALLRLAGVSSQVGQAEDAAKYYDQALRVVREANDRSSEAVILSALANASLNAAEAATAIKYYELALPIVREMNDKASQSNIFNRLGMAAYFMGEIHRAIDYYQQELEIAHDKSAALFNIGEAYHVAGDVEKATLYYKDALALDMPPTNYKCALGLGIVCLQKENQEEAKNHFEHCINLLKNIPETTPSFHPRQAALGMSLLAVGRTQEGLEVYSHALGLSPPREFLYYAIQDLRLLQSGPQPIAGLAEAMNMIEKVFNEGKDRT